MQIKLHESGVKYVVVTQLQEFVKQIVHLSSKNENKKQSRRSGP